MKKYKFTVIKEFKKEITVEATDKLEAVRRLEDKISGSYLESYQDTGRYTILDEGYEE